MSSTGSSEPRARDTGQPACEHEWIPVGTQYRVTPDPNWSLIPLYDDYECTKCHTERRVSRDVSIRWARDNLPLLEE